MKSTPRFVALDSWRGLCACLVAMFHYTQYTLFLDVPFIRNAYLFVDFFFVLSGFVITASYASRLASGYSTLKFMLLRFGRVYPLHLFTFGIFLMLALLKYFSARHGGPQPFESDIENPHAIITNLLLIHSLNLHDSNSWNFPSWSISTEFYSYLFFAIVVTVFRRHFAVVMGIVVILSPIFIGLYSPKYMDTTYDYGFIRCLFGFGIGSLLWKIYEKYIHEHKLRANKNKLIWTALELACVLIVVLFVTTAGDSPLSIAAPLVFAAVIVVFTYENGFISGILLTRGFVTIGTLSYSIYMMHIFILFFVGNLLFSVQRRFGIEIFSHFSGNKFLGVSEFASGMVYLILMLTLIASAFVTYKGIEAPGRAYFRRIVKARGNA